MDVREILNHNCDDLNLTPRNQSHHGRRVDRSARQARGQVSRQVSRKAGVVIGRRVSRQVSELIGTTDRQVNRKTAMEEEEIGKDNSREKQWIGRLTGKNDR